MGREIIKSESDQSVDNLPGKYDLEAGISYAEFHVYRQYMSELSSFQVESCDVMCDEYGKQIDEYSDMRIYKIAHLVIDKNENPTDKLASVYWNNQLIGVFPLLP